MAQFVTNRSGGAQFVTNTSGGAPICQKYDLSEPLLVAGYNYGGWDEYDLKRVHIISCTQKIGSACYMLHTK